MFKRFIGNLFERDGDDEYIEKFRIYKEYGPCLRELNLPYSTKMGIKKLGKLFVGDDNIYYGVMYNTGNGRKTHYRLHPAGGWTMNNYYPSKEEAKRRIGNVKFINLDKLQGNYQ